MNYWYKKGYIYTNNLFLADIRGGNLKWLNEQKEERSRRALIDYICAVWANRWRVNEEGMRGKSNKLRKQIDNLEAEVKWGEPIESELLAGGCLRALQSLFAQFTLLLRPYFTDFSSRHFVVHHLRYPPPVLLPSCRRKPSVGAARLLLSLQLLHSQGHTWPMAPLLLTHFRPRQRSLLSTLFTATFLGAVIVVAFPCPARASGETRLESPGPTTVRASEGRREVVLLMNERGKRRFMEERWLKDVMTRFVCVSLLRKDHRLTSIDSFP